MRFGGAGATFGVDLFGDIGTWVEVYLTPHSALGDAQFSFCGSILWE